MLLPSNDPVDQPPFALHIGWYGTVLGLLIALYATPPLCPPGASRYAWRAASSSSRIGRKAVAPAKKVRPLQNQPRVYWLDDPLLQVTSVPIANFCAASTCADTTATGNSRTGANPSARQR